MYTIYIPQFNEKVCSIIKKPFNPVPKNKTKFSSSLILKKFLLTFVKGKTLEKFSSCHLCQSVIFVKMTWNEHKYVPEYIEIKVIKTKINFGPYLIMSIYSWNGSERIMHIKEVFNLTKKDLKKKTNWDLRFENILTMWPN